MITKPVLIGDFLHRIRRAIDLKPDSKYKLVTIKLKHKGVVLRQEKLAADIKSKMYQVQAGDFILSGIDARNGAFGIVPPELDGAIVTNDFWYFDIDEELVDKHFFLELTSTKWFDEICRKGSDGTTQRIRLQKNKFFNQTVFLPSLDEQRTFIERFKRVKSKDSQIKSELTHQQTLLKKLRQQILQEAIEGKLTADWRKKNPDVESASKLLERIAAEKARLIEEKKIKKQKPLPPINEEEKPFDLPEGWEWCRYGDVMLDIEAGKSPTCYNYPASNDEWGVLKISAVSWGDFQENENKKLKPSTAPFVEKEVKNGDFIMTRANTKELVAKSVIVREIRPKLLLNDKTLRVNFSTYVDQEYLNYFNNGGYARQHYISVSTGASPSMKNISRANIKALLLPLPSLDEQQAVVAKVEKLSVLCEQLETQITQNQAHAEQLMQAVLKEAFQSESSIKNSQLDTSKSDKTQSQDNLILFNPAKADYDKRTLLAAEIVYQLHREPTLGHLKLQKLIYLCQKTEQMQLPTNFLQQAAGPYDPEMARSLDKQLNDKKWFCYQREERLKYLPLDNAGEHRADFDKHFAQQKEGIHTLINLFRKEKSDHMEIVATLYACWERLLQENAVVSDEMIFKRFYQWSEEKAKYPLMRLKTVIQWMCKQDIVPKDVI